jgi:hypothetical protein
MNSDTYIRERIEEYLREKDRLTLDREPRIVAQNRTYSWWSSIDKTFEDDVLPLIKIPKGKLLGGFSVNIFDIGLNLYQDLNDPLNFRYVITNLPKIHLIHMLAGELATDNNIIYSFEEEYVKRSGGPIGLRGIFSAVQEGSFVAKKSIDRVVQAVREFDSLVYSPDGKKRLEEEMKTHFDLTRKQIHRFRKRYKSPKEEKTTENDLEETEN